MNNNIKVSWKEIEYLVVNIANKIVDANFNPDVIIAVLRGGMVPARLLCNYFEKARLYTVDAKLYENDWQANNVYRHNMKEVEVGDFNIESVDKDKNIIIIDDISDSGKTFKAVLNEMCNKYSISYDSKTLKTASLYLRKSSEFVPHFYGEKVEHKKWFNFPWEKK